MQGKYALESNISTAVSNDAETGIYRCNYHDLICMDRPNDPKFLRFDRKLLLEILSYFDGDTIKIRLIENVGGDYKYLQIQDLFSRVILMPMKDID